MPVVGIRFTRSRKRFINYPVVRDEMFKTHDTVIKPVFVKAFKDIVANWSNRPDFQTRTNLNQDSITLSVFPAGDAKAKQIWTWNVEGTKPHPIAAKNAPFLVFPWGGKGSYMAKTGPGGSWYGGPGTVANAQIVRMRQVMHPGTKPRDWPKVIREQQQGFYSRSVENAWRRALRRI